MEFCDPKTDFDIFYVGGDTVVPMASSSTPAIKWADDFDHGVPNSKPVKLVQICSGLNQRETPYDGKDKDGVNIFTKNEIQGLECNCSQG